MDKEWLEAGAAGFSLDAADPLVSLAADPGGLGSLDARGSFAGLAVCLADSLVLLVSFDSLGPWGDASVGAGGVDLEDCLDMGH